MPVDLPPFTWDAVELDCRGNPEPDPAAIVYLVPEVLVEPAGFVHRCATDEETGDEVCRDDIVYQDPVLIGERVYPCCSLPVEDLYTPGPGGVTFFEIGSMDEAGNRWDLPCPEGP